MAGSSGAVVTLDYAREGSTVIIRTCPAILISVDRTCVETGQISECGCTKFNNSVVVLV
jgi:hypothetical protein